MALYSEYNVLLQVWELSCRDRKKAFYYLRGYVINNNEIFGPRHSKKKKGVLAFIIQDIYLFENGYFVDFSRKYR